MRFITPIREWRILFGWPKLKDSVKRVVEECDPCARNKSEIVAYPGLLQPLPTPPRSWSDITMDFIEGGGWQVHIIYPFSYSESSFYSFEYGQIFFKHVYKLHGVPARKWLTAIGYSLPCFGENFWD